MVSRSANPIQTLLDFVNTTNKTKIMLSDVAYTVTADVPKPTDLPLGSELSSYNTRLDFAAVEGSRFSGIASTWYARASVETYFDQAVKMMDYLTARDSSDAIIVKLLMETPCHPNNYKDLVIEVRPYVLNQDRVVTITAKPDSLVFVGSVTLFLSTRSVDTEYVAVVCGKIKKQSLPDGLITDLDTAKEQVVGLGFSLQHGPVVAADFNFLTNVTELSEFAITDTFTQPDGCLALKGQFKLTYSDTQGVEQPLDSTLLQINKRGEVVGVAEDYFGSVSYTVGESQNGLMVSQTYTDSITIHSPDGWNTSLELIEEAINFSKPATYFDGVVATDVVYVVTADKLDGKTCYLQRYTVDTDNRTVNEDSRFAKVKIHFDNQSSNAYLTIIDLVALENGDVVVMFGGSLSLALTPETRFEVNDQPVVTYDARVETTMGFLPLVRVDQYGVLVPDFDPRQYLMTQSWIDNTLSTAAANWFRNDYLTKEEGIVYLPTKMNHPLTGQPQIGFLAIGQQGTVGVYNDLSLKVISLRDMVMIPKMGLLCSVAHQPPVYDETLQTHIGYGPVVESIVFIALTDNTTGQLDSLSLPPLNNTTYSVNLLK